jgi:hypothetical protein
MSDNKQCNHEPTEVLISGYEQFGKVTIEKGTMERLLSKTRACKNCGVELVVQWIPKDQHKEGST